MRQGLDSRPGDQRRTVQQALAMAGLVLVLLALAVLAWRAMAEVNSADTAMSTHAGAAAP